jgi:fimbrial chaperone protein
VPAAQAGSFAVSPVRITLDNRHRSVAALTVRNNSDVATVVQAQAMQWLAAGSDDDYRPTSELLVTPAVFTLAPRGQQVVRVGLRDRTQSTSAERTFRLYLNEVPTPPDEGFRGMNVALRLGVPIFVTAPDTAAKLAVELRAGTADTLQLLTQNTGDAHLRLQRVVIADTGGAVVLSADLARDVLAGQTRQFDLPLPSALPAGTELRVQLFTEAGVEAFRLRAPG